MNAAEGRSVQIVGASIPSKSATYSLAFGIAAVILLPIGYFTFFWMPYLGWMAGVVALFFGIKALRQPTKLLDNSKTKATAGTVIGVVLSCISQRI